ncbi:MAG: hypothetical protein ACOC2F_03220 [Bacteroidota bacterium]
MKQHASPVIIHNNEAFTLQKASYNTDKYNEAWIQEICFANPQILPFEELEPTFEGMVPVCKELSTNSGYADLVFVNEYGFITIGECKLWRNPEARRKVVGQILDYAKDLAKWDYSKFELECLKARKTKEKSLYEVIHQASPETEESDFVDNVQKNLSKGRFLLTLIGDGIRENTEDLVKYIHRNGNLNFTLGLIELPVFENPMDKSLLITPRIVSKTKEIERIIYRVSEEKYEEEAEPQKVESQSRTISEKVFYERLEQAIGKAQAKELQDFVEELNADLNIVPKLGRGKRISLNLKSGDEKYNFASVQEDGEVWFYGIVNKTEEIGNKQIGINYLTNLAKITQASIDNKGKEWAWGVKKNGKNINIQTCLKVSEQWKNLISNTLEDIYRLEDSA